ncbi:dihydrodipicolinate synthase DapA [Psychroflexus torquis ATCC 700755]|uniref:4-hydroxy-tetrahydrodipicolinate synthase n=1 Tax=Psychroflexus torquis (strain ATCC 700755 / CIP 106069 / ACAM 623) TaxID=313595 RepID=K4IET2_PSYTT|nr:4-hydroxy-tetrahydrodipicolinate synthase [Psychroflexus torquis]AFU67591.1 dihydrodipicolinate synthase DapA [Psychroflexus torquis ATCC 700755]
MKQFLGTGVALVTPFTRKNEIDENALRKLVQFQIKNGVDYIVVLGTTAESATLSKVEKETVKNIIKSENNGQLSLVLGLGGNSTSQVVEDLAQENLEGFDAILSVSPFYNKPSQEGIYQHFSEVSKASKLPLIVYNVPGRTGSNMLPLTVTRLAKDFDNIIGIKEAAGDIVQAMAIIRDTPDDFLVISGDDMLALPMVLAGGAGVISVMAQGYPAEFSKMLNLGREGNVKEAFTIQFRLMDGIDLIFKEGNPAGIKAVFELKNLCESGVRLPLVEASSILKSALKVFNSQMK